MLPCGLMMMLLMSPARESEKKKQKTESLHEVVVVSATRLEQPLLETTSLVSKVSRFR